LQVANRAVAVGRRSLRELVPPYKTRVFANENPSRRCATRPGNSGLRFLPVAHRHALAALARPRRHAHHGTAGMGHVYQGRFKSFPIAADEHLLSVLWYVEQNPVRAELVSRAESCR
jgi:hypothetical protein